MPTYRVRPGKTHGKNREYKEGGLVTLTKEEAGSFLDKLELVSEKDDAKVKAAQDSAEQDETGADEGDLTLRHLEAQKETATDIKSPKNQGTEEDPASQTGKGKK